MPTSYAHYRFGRMVVNQLPPEYQYFAHEYPEYFYPALHGPDLTFYLIPSPKVARLGDALHKWTGKDYFSFVGKPILSEMAGEVQSPRDYYGKELEDAVWDVHVPKAVELFAKRFRHGVQPQSALLGKPQAGEYGQWTKRSAEKRLAYMYGFLCHFALDRTGHKYINKQVDMGTASHFAIEAEFDRLLMSMDGYDPLTHHVTDHIHPSMELAEDIRLFFPGLNTSELYACLRLQKFLLTLFNLPGRLPRKLFMAATRAAGQESFGELFMPEFPDPKCFGTNEQLLTIFDASIPEAVDMITNLMDYLTGKQPWDDKFLWNFEGEYKGE